MKLVAASACLALMSKVEAGSFSHGGFNFPTFPAYYTPFPPPSPPAPTPTPAPTDPPVAPGSMVPSTIPRSSGLETCCDEETNSCQACEWFDSRSCQQLLDENAICGGDCCAFEDAPNGGCTWKTGGGGSCCVTTDSGNLWTLQHVGEKACPVSQYNYTPFPPPSPPAPTPTPAPTDPPVAPGSMVPSTIPVTEGWHEHCCDEETNDCQACERFESRSCQQLLDENAICGGDCCAFEDAPNGGCIWKTGGGGSCCVMPDSASLSWTLDHTGEKACPASQYKIPYW